MCTAAGGGRGVVVVVEVVEVVEEGRGGGEGVLTQRPRIKLTQSALSSHAAGRKKGRVKDYTNTHKIMNISLPNILTTVSKHPSNNINLNTLFIFSISLLHKKATKKPAH